MFKKYIFILAITTVLCSCDRQTTSLSNQKDKQLKNIASSSLLLTDPTKVEQFESAAEALSLWRQTSDVKPTLLLLSKNSQLQPIPEAIKPRALNMVANASLDQFRTSSLPTAIDPVILPNMALSAALEANLFSNVIWALPTPAGRTVTLESFLQKLFDMKDINEEEAASFQGDEKSFFGTIRNTPFTVILKDQIPAINTPVIVHMDISFLAEDYHNEIRTPLYQHTFDTLKQLRELKLQALSFSISQSNLTREISLKTRFLGSLIEKLVSKPNLLDKPLSGNDKLRNEALYLGSFFKKEDVLELYRKMIENDPNDAAIHYDLYQTLRQFNSIDEALDHLDQAAKIDQPYAMEYLDLAELAIEKRQLGGVMKMLEKASLFSPENPFIKISLADFLIQAGHGGEAEKILEELKALPWSTTYHANTPRYLDEMLTAAKEEHKPDGKTD